VNKSKLKLGILLDSCEVPAWAYYALERMVDSDYAEISLIILNDSQGIDESKSAKLWNNKHKIVYCLFNKIDERLFYRQPNAFEPRHAMEILLGVPVLPVTPIQKSDSDYFEPSDIDKIRECGLDILIKMGFRRLRGDIFTASRCGIWMHHHGDNRINGAGPFGFWEVVQSWPETSSMLLLLGEDGNDSKVLYKSQFSTYPFSPARNRSYSFWLSSPFLPRQVELLHRLGEKRFFAQTARFNEEFDVYNRGHYTVPSNMLTLRLIAKIFAKIILEIYQRTFYLDTWYLMFDLTKNTPLSFDRFNAITPPKDRFWADPQAIQRDGHYYVFVEEYIYRAKKGHISVLEIDQQGNYKDPVPVLEKAYHLSYPFVFEWGDRYYMVPESAANKTIDLYECIEFPNKWKFKMSLMESIRAVDTTLFYYDEKWWLFTGMAENEGASPQTELFLFFSNELLTSEWNPHPLNPVVSDAIRARPAGRVFVRDGKIFRPSQDCSKMYGFGFDINEILLLSETEYLEKKVVSVRPHSDKRILATHTLTSEGQLTMVDAFTRRRKLL
jgi:hypothetical protein